MKLSCSHAFFVLSVLVGLTAHAQKKQTCAVKFESKNICLNYEWEKGPDSSREGSILVMLLTNLKTEKPFEPAGDPKVAVRLFMEMSPEHNNGMGGHPGPPTSVSRLLDSQNQVIPGAFRVLMHFTMSGPWQIQFLVYDPDHSSVSEKVVETIP